MVVSRRVASHGRRLAETWETTTTTRARRRTRRRVVAPRASALDKRCSYDGRGRVAASFTSSSAAGDDTASAAAATAHMMVMMTHRSLGIESHLLGGRRHFNGR